MVFKFVVLSTLLVVALAEKPHIGLSVPFLKPRIVGGSEAPPGEYPFQVSLQRYGSHFCGGIIIDPEWVMTAGHCVLAMPDVTYITVKAGKHNIRNQEPTEIAVSVEKGYVHPDYSGGVAPYDIALLKLSKPLEFSRSVGRIQLPPSEEIPEDDAEVVLSGWGSISPSGYEMPVTLQHAKLHVVDIPKCRVALEAVVGSSPLHETNVCTGPLTGGLSACSGDSGGPLITKGPQGPKVIGIVSWGVIPCGTYGAPSVYTRVSAFTGWIRNVRSGMYDKPNLWKFYPGKF